MITSGDKTKCHTIRDLRIFFEDRRIVRICHLKLQWVRVYYFNEFPI